MQLNRKSFMYRVLLIPCLLMIIFADRVVLAQEFTIGEYQAYAILGEPNLNSGTDYISFTGDFGFSGWLPTKEVLSRHIAIESKLLANFQLNVINLEFMLPGISGRELDRQIDDVMIDLLIKSGYKLIARANNHVLDYDYKGAIYNSSKLMNIGLSTIGMHDSSVYEWTTSGRQVAIYAFTAYVDREDPKRFVLRIDDADIEFIKQQTSTAHFRIAFVHLGSMSSFPSPHERKQVKRVLEGGADLVICTGSHFIKGFVMEQGKPVVYGLGNHLFSYAGGDTESVGIHLVAGFKSGELTQLFAIPFFNTVREGRTGPLDKTSFTWFKTTFQDRSTNDPNRYFSDPRNLNKLKYLISKFKFSSLREFKIRHLVYVPRILFHQYPLVVIVGGVLALAPLLFLIHWIVFTRNRKKTRTSNWAKV